MAESVGLSDESSEGIVKEDDLVVKSPRWKRGNTRHVVHITRLARG